LKLSDKIKTINVLDLKPYPKNSIIHTENQIEKIAKNIKENGYYSPIGVDKNNVIVFGHGRYEAIKILGIEKIEVYNLSDKTDKQIKKLRILDNKITSDHYDKDLLRLEIEDIYDGFDNSDIIMDELYIDEEKLNILIPAQETDGDNEITEKVEQITKFGDLWELGDHRLLCGNSTEKDDFIPFIGNTKIDMFITDPPYGVSYADKNEFLNSIDKGNIIQEQIINDNKSVEEISSIWLKCFSLVIETMKESSVYYIFSPQGSDLMMMMMMIKESGLKLKHQIIWVKNNHVLGRCDYMYKHEPIFYGWKDKHKFYGNGKQNKSVWEFDKPHANKLHPTMKPIELIENAILNSTLRDNIVLDTFIGSGSTLIACEKTNRKCYGIEIDEHYCDVIRDRYIEF